MFECIINSVKVESFSHVTAGQRWFSFYSIKIPNFFKNVKPDHEIVLPSNQDFGYRRAMTMFDTPFKIGLKPLAQKDWLQIDDRLESYLAEKDKLFSAYPDQVFVEEEDTRTSQAEVLSVLIDYLMRFYPQIYQRDGKNMMINQRRVGLTKAAPLLIAGRLLPDDLILMRKSAAGWRLVAASLCFPSSWVLREKFGKPLAEIHQHVPEFGLDTRNAKMIERIFDNIEAGKPVWRQNWGLYNDDDLYHPRPSQERLRQPEEDDISSDPFVRTESQSLYKLPQSQDILFTVNISVIRASLLKDQPGGERGLKELSAQLAEMSDEQKRYKGFSKKLEINLD